MRTTWTLPDVSDEQILHVERAIVEAFDARSTEGLNILGLGELGLAVGWPTAEPLAVFKRQAPGPSEQVESDMERMRRFHRALVDAGARVIPTDVRTITKPDGKRIPYLIQPVVKADDLVENILASAQPRADHPVLISLRDTVMNVVRDDADGGLSIDAQITNFAWDGEAVVSLDTTPPLIWEASSGPLYEVGNYLTAVPRVVRSIATKLTMKTGDDYRTARGVLEMTAVFLLRIDQERWVDEAISCFNQTLDQPLARSAVNDQFARIMKDLPMIKRLARIQRFWITKARRERYEFFITNSFTGEIY